MQELRVFSFYEWGCFDWNLRKWISQIYQFDSLFLVFMLYAQYINTLRKGRYGFCV